jgi:hypothetical protein
MIGTFIIMNRKIYLGQDLNPGPLGSRQVPQRGIKSSARSFKPFEAVPKGAAPFAKRGKCDSIGA